MDKQEVSSAQKIWEGEIRGTKLRILQVAENELASEAYMMAFLEAHKLLKSVADFAVGNRP